MARDDDDDDFYDDDFEFVDDDDDDDDEDYDDDSDEDDSELEEDSEMDDDEEKPRTRGKKKAAPKKAASKPAANKKAGPKKTTKKKAAPKKKATSRKAEPPRDEEQEGSSTELASQLPGFGPPSRQKASEAAPPTPEDDQVDEPTEALEPVADVDEPEDEYGRPAPQANYVVHIYELKKFKRTIDRAFTPEEADAFVTEYNRTSKLYNRWAVPAKNDIPPGKVLAQ